jgi:GT2 family glycosyltransferase
VHKVSILIPCYNAERWVAEAIQSALDQTHEDKEIIVVDDGSTDGSLEIIQSFGDQIKWETGPNQGGNVTRNRLLELSTGEWLQYLDADDYLLPEKVSAQLEEARDPSSYDLLWSPGIYEYWNEDGTVRQEPQTLHDEDPWVALIRWRLPQTGASLWRSSKVKSVGGWKPDQPRCQEHELYLRLLQHDARFKFCPSALSVYRQWSLDTVCRRDPLSTTRTRMQVVENAESILQSSGRLTQNLRTQLLATRVQCARSCYSLDRGFSVGLARLGIEKSGMRTLPVEPWFPKVYRRLFRFYGFSFAEALAAFGRKRRALFGKNKDA